MSGRNSTEVIVLDLRIEARARQEQVRALRHALLLKVLLGASLLLVAVIALLVLLVR